MFPRSFFSDLLSSFAARQRRAMSIEGDVFEGRYSHLYRVPW